MNGKKHAILILMVAGVFFILTPKTVRPVDDGAALFKTKCAPCHGADGTGKPAIKAPSLVSDAAKKKSSAELTDAISNGGKDKKPAHTFSQKGLTPDQIKSLVSYIREMQKK